MLSSKRNKVLLVVSSVVLLGLFLYAFLRDTAEIIPLQNALELIENKNVYKVIASKIMDVSKRDSMTDNQLKALVRDYYTK